MTRRARWLAVASVVWLALALWALAADSRPVVVAALVAGMALLAAVWLLLRATDGERRRWQHTLDAMQAGIVLYDADDRLVLTNAEFRSLYQLGDNPAPRGMPFEELLRTRVRRGLVPEAAGQEEAWIAERLAQHRGSEARSFLREMADSRWRRITEQRLPDGSRLGFSIDVTELVENQRALDAARREAERAHQMMGDAIEAMPAAVEIYDRSDRLVRFNQRMLQLYPHMLGKTLLGETFEALVRSAVAQGKVPDALGREEQWLAERLKSRGQSSAPRLQQAPSGAWYQIYETPMPRGGLVTVRLDATELVQQREELRTAQDRAANDHALLVRAREELEAAAAAMPQAHAPLERLSTSDSLTGLANRRRSDMRLAADKQGATMKPIVFWFDPISPFACLAFEQLPQALDGCTYTVEYRPLLFAGLLQHWGQKGPAEIESKRAWTYRHVAWQAQQHGIVLQMPALHPFNPLPLLRLCIAAGPNRRVVEALMRHVWRGGGDAGDPARIDALTRELAPARDPSSAEVKAELRAGTDAAIARGVFGVPMFELDGRLFWGLDALPMLRAALLGDAWFDGPAWDEGGQPRPGVQRQR